MDIYLQGMRDRRMRSGTNLPMEIYLIDWSTAGNLSNGSSGVQIPRDICTRLRRYLYSAKCSWIIRSGIICSSKFMVGFPQVMLSENLLLGTVNVREQYFRVTWRLLFILFIYSPYQAVNT